MKHRNDTEFNAKLYGKQKFGFRKLSVGLAAVALGTTFLMSNGELVHADTTDAQNGNQTEEVKDNNTDQDLSSTSNAATQQNQAKSETESSQNANNETQIVSIKDLGQSPTVGLEESKAENNVTITASRNGQQINKNESQNMMAGQDTVNVKIDIEHPQINNDKQLTINLPNAGTNKSFKVQPSTIKIKDENSESYWDVNVNTNDSNSQIIATWNSISNNNPANLKLDLPVQGNDETIKSSTNNQIFNVEISGHSQTAFSANLTPYKEKVTEDEILKGFPMGEKTFDSVNGSYAESKNMSSDDINKYKINKDSEILQWGIYFNYGNQKGNTNLKPLLDVVFNTYFDGDQVLIPSSIKVFEVPDGMAVDNNGYRNGINDFYIDPKDQTQKENYYSKITNDSNNQRDEFANYLRNHITYDKSDSSYGTQGRPNGFAVNQTKDNKNSNGHVPFHIPGDSTHDYSTHAYFIQLDTVIKDNKKPGDGTRINYQAYQGKGKQISEGNNWLNSISGTTDTDHTPKPDDQTSYKFINYQVKYVYKNGTLASIDPFFSSTPSSIQIKSLDSGSTWTQYSVDGGRNWKNIQNKQISFDVPEITNHNNNKYTVIDEKGISVTKNKSSIPSNNVSKVNIKVTVTVDPSTVNDGDNFIVTVPYYTTEHADVRFVDDNNPHNPINLGNVISAIKDTQGKQKYTLTETTDNADNGLPSDYSNKDNNSTSSPITFKKLNEIMSDLKAKGYTFEKVNGGNSIANKDGSEINFGNFDNDQTKDQHFVIYLVHKTEQQTKTIDETINYVDEDNNNSLISQGKQIPLTFTRTVDLVDDNKSTPWTFDGMFNEVENPTFKNYQIDLDATKITEVLNYIKDTKETFDKSSLASTSTKSVGAVSFTSDSVAKLPDGISHLVITVPYKRLENIHIHYIDEDNDGQEINNSTNSNVDNTKLFNGVFNQLAGASNIDNNTPASIKYLESLGYIFDKDATNGETAKHGDFDTSKNNFNETNGTKNIYNGKLTADSTNNPDDQNYYVYLYHNINHDLEEKTVTENIKYIDEATKKEIHDQYQTGKLTFTRDIYSDQVTGKVTYSKWSVGAFKAVSNPKISGYTIDPKHITEQLNGKDSQLAATSAKEIGIADFHTLSDDEISALPDGAKLDIVVPYIQNPTPNPEPTQPTKPTEPTQPTQATTPETPKKPKTPKIPKKPDRKKTNKKHTTSTFNPHSEHGNHKRTTNTVPTKAERNNNVSSKSQHITTPKSTNVNTQENVNTISTKSTLPQTSEKQNKLSVFGLGVLALSALFGLADIKKRKNH